MPMKSTEPRLEIGSLPNPAPSAAPRQEIKFAIPRADLGKFRSILEINCRPVRYGNETSRVMSLYFDDALLTSCRLNLDGAARRSKVRLRWYDTHFPEGALFFEVKKRTDEALVKERIALRARMPRGTMPLRGLAEELSLLLPDTASELLRQRPEPILITEYERRYFEAVDAPIRVTIDSDLAFYPQLGRREASRRFGERAPDLVILEVKAPVGCEARARELLHPMAPWVSRSSKYVMGCQYLGLLSGGHYGAP
jgi:VTC domain